MASLAGCGAGAARPAATPAPVRSAKYGFTAELPAGWRLASQSLTPQLRNPVEILSAGTVRDARPQPGSCAQLPVGALERMGPRDVFVTVQERYGEPRFPARPAHFGLTGRVEHGGGPLCAENERRLNEYRFDFRDARRGFHVLVALGRDAPPRRRAQALALLDSLRFAPGPQGVRLDPDLAMRFADRAAGLSWQMPVPSWRRYDWRLTSLSMPVERLALGTFALRRGPPDANCTPRAAIDALPPDGAFIFVLEDVDQPPPSVPERAGEIALGPEEPYECMGTSRMAIWRQAGRVFQAHVYLGPRASEQVRQDVRSILNSIQVR